jgi:hypothetical protein
VNVHGHRSGDFQEIPAAARRMLTRAFEQAAGQLRPEVSVDAEVLACSACC